MAKQIKKLEDPEITAIGEVYAALKELDTDARSRVLSYVSSKFYITAPVSSDYDTPSLAPVKSSTDSESPLHDDFEGVSPAGKKWITRNGINSEKLMSIFSLGIDEIDLVSKSVPGKNKAQRMREIFLLKGIAAYLGTGTPRFTHDQIKEACLHYDAWDSKNSTKIFKTMTAEVSGGADSGYTLTAKGLSEGTNLIKRMTGSE